MPNLLPGSGVVDSTYDEKQDMELLNAEDKEVDATASPEEEVDETASTEEVEEVEEAEEEQEEQEEETEEEPKDKLASRPTIKDIKAEFPEFFNKFPEVKALIFKAEQFSSYFPTIEDAKEAFEDNAAFNKLSESSLEGDSSAIIGSLKETDPKAFELFSASFLPNLYKSSPEVYNTVVTPLIENVLRHAYKNARNEDMKNSAFNLAQYILGVEDPTKILEGKETLSKVTELNQEQEKHKKERLEKDTTAFRAAAGDTESRFGKSLTAQIAKTFDPDSVFSPFVRKQLISEVVKRINKQLVGDKAHCQVMQAYWKRARSRGYPEAEKGKIVITSLARAKTLMPSIVEAVRSEALGKEVKRVEKKAKTIPIHRESVNGGRTSRVNASALTPRDYKKMSDDEILAM